MHMIPLPRQYIDLSIRGNEKDNDRQYGVKHDIEKKKFKIGGFDLEIIGKGINVTVTPGIYEFLFKKIILDRNNLIWIPI